MNLLKVLGGDLVGDLLDRVAPKKLSSTERAKLKQEFEVAVMAKESEIEKGRADIIKAEAQSEDPWVSRARPTFLWIMYFVIIFNYIFIPLVGMVGSAFGNIQIGATFVSIELPDRMWDMFQWGFLGYVGFRTADKTGVVGKLIGKK